MITDDDLHSRLRNEFAPVRMRMHVDGISARGRSFRRRRRVATAACAGLVAAALLLGLPGTQLPGLTGTQPRMDLAAWSVEPEPDGTVVLTIRQLADADRLSATLRQAGVPALVEFKQLKPGVSGGCAENGQPWTPVDGVLGMGRAAGAGPGRMTIRPSLMPPGTTLHIVIFQMPSLSEPDKYQRSVRLGLVKGEPLPCVVP
jgi:hypothetical protein